MGHQAGGLVVREATGKNSYLECCPLHEHADPSPHAHALLRDSVAHQVLQCIFNAAVRPQSPAQSRLGKRCLGLNLSRSFFSLIILTAKASATKVTDHLMQCCRDHACWGRPHVCRLSPMQPISKYADRATACNCIGPQRPCAVLKPCSWSCTLPVASSGS